MKEPKIRFKGFQREWETSIIGDMCSISTGKSNTQDKIEDGKYPFSVRSPFVERSNKFLFDEEAVLTVGDGVGTGKVFHYVNGKYDLHQRVYRMFDFCYIYVKYFYYYFSTKFYKRVMSMTAKSSVDSVRMDMIADMKIDYPSTAEQQSIASYFQHLDNLIQSTTKKIESLKQVKAASLQSMFPQEGETTPRVRFKGFEGEWEETPFSETFYYLKNNSLSRAELSDGGVVMNIHYGDVLIKYGECVDVGKEVKTFVKEEYIAKRLHQSCAIINGDIIFADAAEDNTVGKCSEIIANEDDAIISGLHTIPCRPMKQFATRYLGYYLNSNAYHNQLLPHIQGTKISSISKKAISQTHINSPLDISEQRAIASYFTNLDRQINLQSQRLEKLKQIKAACLDKMFV